MRIEYSTRFLKRAQKLTSANTKKLSQKIEWFKRNPFDKRLKSHALGGKLKGHFAFSLDYAKRVVFLWINKKTVLFINVGSHNEVYR